MTEKDASQYLKDMEAFHSEQDLSCNWLYESKPADIFAQAISSCT